MANGECPASRVTHFPAKGPSIYDVHTKKSDFLPPLPSVHMRPHEPDPLLWTSTRGRHKMFIAVLKWLVQ